MARTIRPTVGDPDAEELEALNDGVRWLYRTKVKDPPDTVTEIARETGESEAFIHIWIAEAYRVLDLAAERFNDSSKGH
jgi:hypothetical protein